MTLTSEELRTSWVWKHRWPTFLVCLLVLVLSGVVSALGPSRPGLGFFALFYMPLGIVDVASIFVLVRLAQLYYAPKRWKDEARN
jgi:hypothetical protein